MSKIQIQDMKTITIAPLNRIVAIFLLATFFMSCENADESVFPDSEMPETHDSGNGQTDSGMSYVDNNNYSVVAEDVSYTLSNIFGGFNGRSSEGPQWTNSDFTSMVEWMSPSSIRYPGGTLANSWDWRQGGIMGKKIKNPYYISDLAKGLPLHTSIVYVMNMVHATPATGYDYTSTDKTILESKDVLDAKIDDALAALGEFEKYGRMPVAIELGNELYFNKEEHYGIYTANPSRYITDAKVIAARIKRVYPDIKVILCSSKSGEKPTSNREVWNTTVYSALQSDSELQNLIDGVVQHHYIDVSIGSQAPLADESEWENVIDAGRAYASSVQHDYFRIPDNMKLWITEYGLAEAGNSNCGRWITGLQYAAMAMSWIPWADKVETIQLQHITLSPGVLTTDKTGLSSVGVLYGELLRSMNGSTKATLLCLDTPNTSGIPPVYCDPAPSRSISSSPKDKVYGWKFENESGITGIVMINPTRYSFGCVSFGEINGKGNQIVVYDSPTPTVNNLALDNGINRREYESTVKQIEIPPFSFVVL